MKANRSTRLQLNIQKWIFTILLLFALGMVAWLSHQHSWQTDMTANKRNSLSPGSVTLLKTLPDAITVNVYTRSDETLRAAVNEILNRYRREKDDITIRLINPDIDIEMAQLDGVTQYGQVVVKYKGRREVITSLSEQAISSALLRLSRDSVSHLVFLQGHGERDPSQSDNRGYSKLSAQLKAKGFAVSTVNLLAESLPDDTDVLVIAGAGKPVLPGELKHITDFIARGGNMLWLADPGKLNTLQTLADLFELRFLDGIVVDNNVDLRKTLRIEHPAIIPVLEYYPHAINKGINYNTLFPLSRGVEPDITGDDPAWQHAILWRSFEQSWSETAGLTDEIVFSSAAGDIAGPITLAVALEKVLTGEQQDKASQRVVVVGDSDFMANAYIGVGANLDLAQNIFDWLAGDDDLIAIELKNAPDLQLQLSDTATMLIGAGFLIVLPVLLLLAGTLIWLRRRNR